MVDRAKVTRPTLRVGVNIRMIQEKPSGIQNFIFGLLKELIKNNQEYEYFLFTTGNKKIEGKTKYIKCDSFLMRFFEKIDHRLANIFFDNLYILKLIKQEKINIFLAPSSILPIYKPKGIKFVTVIHDLSFLGYKHNPLRLYMNLVMYMKTLMPFVIKRADAIVVDSFFVKKQLEKVYKADSRKIKVIYPGRDNFFYPEKDEAVFLKLVKKYRVQKKFIFTTATNHERKNIFGLINAFKEINQFNEYQLIICGLLPDFAIVKLEEYLREMNLTKKVKYLGFVPKEELRILYSFAKLFVFPSFEEGFGLPILETASCGCLPICSSAGSLPEVIGNNELLFNPKSIKSITKKIDETLSWPEEIYFEHLQKVKRHICKFSWQKAADQYLELFKC